MILLRMEVYIEEVQKDKPLCDEQKYTCSTEEKMDNLNLNLKGITYYLIQLFYKTGKKYSCTQTKLGKLLSILAFQYARRNEKLFNEIIYKYPPRCGTLIKDLTFIPKDIYIRDITIENPDNTSIINDVLDDNIIIPEPYNETGVLPFEVEQHIENIFRLFGAYPASVLGELLNPIVDRIIDVNTDKINLDSIQNFNIEDFDESEKNEIVCFIYQ